VILLLFVIEAFLFPHVVAEVDEEELARATAQAEAEERRLAGVVPGVMVGVALLVLGTFMDMAPLILICTPILLPVMKLVGVDPVHFGIVMMLNLSIGLVTPPVGTVLFVGCAIGKVAIEKVTPGLWPFWIAMLVVLMLVTYLPALAMWVPNLVYGR
jgi:TRAP-type C4-dicarboxylate transport system permease large subunit